MAVINRADPATMRHIYDEINKTLFQEHKDICLIEMPRANYEDQLRYIDYFIQDEAEGHITYSVLNNESNDKSYVSLMFMKK